VKTNFLIMRPEEPNEGQTVDLPRRPTYDQLAAVVRPLLGCEWFEHVTVLADFAGGLAFHRADMFVDEMGHPKNLPRNGKRDRDLSAQRAPPSGRERPGNARLDRRSGGAV